MKTISISGTAFEISAPYAAGHVLNEAEAKTLNQTRAENIGNNFRTDVKKALEAPEGEARDTALAAVREALAKYDTEYAFSMTQARTPIDPIEAEAFRIAKEVLKVRIAEKFNLTVKAYLAIEGNEAKYEANLEKLAAQDDVLKEAKKRVAAKNKVKDLGGSDELAL